MEITNPQSQNLQTAQPVHWGHFGAVLAAMVLLLAATWMKQPQLFSFHKIESAVDLSDVPRYYAYVQPEEDALPLVAGANTNDGPSVINEDGSVETASLGQVLGASTEGVTLSLDDIQVSEEPDSSAAVQKYFSDSKAVESGPIDSTEFEAALVSGSQALMDKQAEKLTGIQQALEKMAVPQSLAKLQKLKILQYSAGAGLMKNFTQADINPQAVSDYFGQFLTSQQNINAEIGIVAKKFPSDVPAYILDQAAVLQDASSQSADILSDINAQ